MCGIAGFYGHGNKLILDKMISKISYRGPDQKQFYLDNKVGLGHNRLSIIDKNSYPQMLHNEKASIWISCNGEIYNYKELKKDLIKRHSFKTNIDTEIIIHLYEDYGTEAFNMLNGMFAFAIYDKTKRKIILVRDKAGEKPLYWGVFNNTLIFSSEIKAITAHPYFKKDIDLQALNQYLFYEYIPTPYTIFNNLKKLKPGHFLTYNHSKIDEKLYWDYTFKKTEESNTNKLKNKFNNLLEDSISKRIDTDSKTGIFLSGGIDSSTIAYYAKKQSNEQIKTFSIGFREKSFDETEYSKKIAKYLNIKNYQKTVSAKEALNKTEKIYSLLDEPMADPSLIPTYFLSKMAKEHVDVCLGGDGMDELMCGYDTFLAEKINQFYLNIPSNVRKKILEKLILKLPTSKKHISLDFKLKNTKISF